MTTTTTTRVLVIGTGFAGLGMAIRLKQRGIEDFVVLEREAGVGGTWRLNTYPGAACDIMSNLYSFSFEPNPSWSRTYPAQAEILAYLERCAEKYGVLSHVRFGRDVVSAVFDDARATWVVTTANGEIYKASVVVSGTGGLSRPSYPDIEGLRSFGGTLFHSARWDHAYDLRDKTVGVIGTGASSIQFVPQIAPKVARLHLFQRTPPWILPKDDHEVSRLQKLLYRAAPQTQRLVRLGIYCRNELAALGFVVDPKLMRYGERLCRQHLESVVADPVLRERLTPTYMVGCKRVLLSNDYLPAVQRPNVELVTDGIERVVPEGVVTRDGTLRRLDALILGTGFYAAEQVAPFVVKGRNGVDLEEVWKDGAEAYLGTTVSGFPNWFMIVGPNTGLGHSSMVYIIESQIAYILSALDVLERPGVRTLDVKAREQRLYNRRLHERLRRSVWDSGCASWYRTKDGKNTTLWPGFTFEFRLATRAIDTDDYELSE